VIVLISDYMGILNLNEDETNLKSLTHNRPLASIPIGGRYRIIDFVLSNMVNIGIKNIGLFTQSNSRSLVDHVGSGKPWDLDRKLNGLFVFNFGVANSYLSDLDMMRSNVEYLYQSKENNVILSPSYMLCNIDYEEAVKNHESSGCDITVIYKKVDNGDKSFIECDILNIGNDKKVISVGKNIGIDKSNNISMEMFIMKKEVLLQIIYSCVKTGYCTNLKEAIYRSITTNCINAYEFKGYLECINSINSYYKTSMDMLQIKVNNELFFNNGLIFTKVKDEAPTKYTLSSNVSNSLIANGCIIEGKVHNSIIFRRVVIHETAEVTNCIIMQGCEIKAGAKLTNVIIDKNNVMQKSKELRGDEEFPLVIEKKALYSRMI
jgi:glucose-1-phosphate adenylyltransferase